MPQLNEAMAAALAQAGRVMERGLDAEPVSPQARSLAAGALKWLDAQRSVSVSRQTSQEIFDHSATKQIEIELAGEIESYLDGAARKIPVRSICRRLIALALLSHPLDGEPAKARQPAKRYQRRPRERTPQELAALQRANNTRREGKEARKRREAASA